LASNRKMVVAAKCAPVEEILLNVEKAGITAAELYTNIKWLHDINKVKRICKKFPFRYAIHAPLDGYEPDLLADMAVDLKAEVVVFHDIYWDNEWEYIYNVFKNMNIKVCVENITTVLEPLKFIRRFGFKRCLDIEHLQMECAGVIEGELLPIIQQTAHIHLSGYFFGSNLWHTPIHYSPQHNIDFMNLIKSAGYTGFIVSEAKTSLQTLSEFENLNKFFQKWERD